MSTNYRMKKPSNGVILPVHWQRESHMFSDNIGQITFTGVAHVVKDSEFVEQFIDIPIVTLLMDVSDPDTPFVDDTFFPFIPYLKPCRQFREFLSLELQRLMNLRQGHVALYPGIKEYQNQLASFSDVESLVRQAKSTVNMLDARRKDAKAKARIVLEALGKTPNTDIEFAHPYSNP